MHNCVQLQTHLYTWMSIQMNVKKSAYAHLEPDFKTWIKYPLGKRLSTLTQQMYSEIKICKSDP